MSDHRSGLRSLGIRTVVLGLFVLAGADSVSPGSRRAAVQPTASGAANVILITLDGVRCQEIFDGLDRAVLRSTLGRGTRVEDTRAYARYWAATPEARRERLMPFFWGTLVTEHGSIAGNRARGSVVRVTNSHRFSYPGYAEILVGEPHDDVIDSNDKRRNPYPTVLEFLKATFGFDKRQVAAFASWDTFDWIVEHEPGAITSNAGFDHYDGTAEGVELLNTLQSETLTPWDGARHDAYTFRLAMAHLRASRPRVLYIAFDETDDWAHDGRYDRVLDTLHLIDGYLRELWSFLQEDRGYRNRTAILITADHGRGNAPADWRDHGSKISGAENIWMAFVGPEWARRGEWQNAEPISQNQVAATLAQALGADYAKQNPGAGRPIAQLLSR
jgi:Type I phosphodiesterase / nucleotide pyrophosphatase